ncbi:MAG: hypothetical protein QM535_21995 [Limnohabitans sp.]|nr:hypothetical protein [Limnohabitans sp.]
MDSVSNISSNYKKPDVILFIVQVSLVFVVVICSLINLTFEWGNVNLWTVLLTSLLGYIMPNPKIKLLNGSINLSQTNKSEDISENITKI